MSLPQFAAAAPQAPAGDRERADKPLKSAAISSLHRVLPTGCHPADDAGSYETPHCLIFLLAPI
jgi:hypothetical protein